MSIQDKFQSWATDTLTKAATTKVTETIQEFAETIRIWKCTPSNHGSQCGVCNIVFWKGDKVRDLLPGCKHTFHFECIYRYVQRKEKYCPVCSKPVRPKIGQSNVDPLAELLET